MVLPTTIMKASVTRMRITSKTISTILPGDIFRLKRSTDHLYAQWARAEDGVDTGVSRWLDTGDHRAYLSGYPDGAFGPDRSMTRAEVAQMLFNLLSSADLL